MSDKIPTIGKVWLIIILVVASLGAVANLFAAGNGIIYIISALVCAGEIVALVFMLQGKGLPYYLLYIACYIVNSILSAIAIGADKTTAWMIGFVIGVLLNIGLTYLAVRKTIEIKK